MSNTKAITSHMRANHPAQLQEAIALGIQRMRQYTGNLSPCSFCHVSFNKTHLCPVFLQMAILELRAVAPDDPLHVTCFLCQFVAADRAQLKQHLTRLHQFPCHDWTPARDSLEDGVTCAHCGSVHHCQQALRKHIIYGHCPNFNPARPWTRNGDADIVEHLAGGRIDLILADVEMKRRLTHDCQFCTQKFQHVPHLVCHLLQQHSELADAGELYRQVLQRRFAPRGCSCIPRIKQFRSAHTCVLFHQLSMIHFNGNALLNIPVVYDDAARDRMDTHVPMKSYLLVHDALKSRDFELLQQDPNFRNTLCSMCLCCGKQVTLTGPSKEHLLRHHLTAMHPEPQQAIQCLIQMVIDRKGRDHLSTCDWCGVSIVPTHANNEYDDHLAECPVLLHFATWLLIPLTPLPHEHRAGGSSQSNPGCAGSTDGLRGTKRALDEETPNHAMGIKAAFDRQRSRTGEPGPSQSAVDAVSTDPSSREGLKLSPPAEHLHPLPVDGLGEDGATTSPSQYNLEETKGKSSSLPVPTSMTDSQPAATPDPRRHQGLGFQEGGSAVAVKLAEQDSTSGFVLAFPQVGPHEEVFGTGCQGWQHRHERHDADSRADLQEDGKARIHHQVPCLAKQNDTSASHSIAIGTRYEGSSASQPADDFGKQQCMAADPSSSQATPSTPIPPRGRPHETCPEEIDRAGYCHIMRDILLVNDDVQCYVNATFLTIIWTHLMCAEFNMGSWIKETAMFLQIVMDGKDSPLCLRRHPLLQSGFSQWQQLCGEHAAFQQDYSEFLTFFLGWVSSKHVAMTSSRRFCRADAVVTAEKSHSNAPILLHSDLWADLCNPKQFQHVIDQWHHSNGLFQAIEQASHILCCQICRYQDTTHMDRTAFELGNLCIHVPCFTDDRLSLARIPYHTEALVHYSGNFKGVHYNCVISHLDKFGDLQWMFHDDNCKPVLWKMVPEWFLYDVTHVWMIRSDIHHQWKQPSDGPHSQESALATVLAQLRNP